MGGANSLEWETFLSVALTRSTKSALYILKMSNIASNAWEGFGGPVSLEEVHQHGIDPGLEDCCRREVSGG